MMLLSHYTTLGFRISCLVHQSVPAYVFGCLDLPSLVLCFVWTKSIILCSRSLPQLQSSILYKQHIACVHSPRSNFIHVPSFVHSDSSLSRTLVLSPQNGCCIVVSRPFFVCFCLCQEFACFDAVFHTLSLALLFFFCLWFGSRRKIVGMVMVVVTSYHRHLAVTQKRYRMTF